MSRPLRKSLSDCATLIQLDQPKLTNNGTAMPPVTSNGDGDIPPWKKELLLRKSALSRTVEPNLSIICQQFEDKYEVKRIKHNFKTLYKLSFLNF
jgi:hypothetical protein